MANESSPHNPHNGEITREWVLSEIQLEEAEGVPNTDYLNQLYNLKKFYCGPDYEFCD